MNKKTAINCAESDYKSSFLQVDKFKIHYIETGKGEPLILIHGWACWQGCWEAVIPDLAKKYHVYAVDLLGHGISSKPLGKKKEYSTSSQADLILKMMDKLSIKKAYIMGHSMGGEVSAKMALKEPKKVKKLVLVSALGMWGNLRKLPLSFRVIRSQLVLYFLTKLSTRLGVFLAFKIFIYYRSNPVSKNIVNGVKYLNLKTKIDKKAFTKITLEGILKDIPGSKVKNIKMPTLLIWGKYDKIVPLKLGEKYHDLVPKSSFAVIDKAGHMVFDEQPKEFLKNVMKFLKK